MKFIYLLVASMFVFVACEKEETEIPNNPIYFSWIIDGNTYSDNSPNIEINSSDVLTIDASDNSVDIRLIIYDFSSKVSGDWVEFGILGINNAYVIQNGVNHTDTQNGQFTFSEIGESKLTGIFNFKSRELINFQSVIVTDGQFSNITY